jgi:hypothetical protein
VVTSDIPQHFALAAVLAAALASVAIWAPRRLAVRAGALGLAALFLPTAWAALGDLMSRPKPVAFAWWERAAERATVVSSQLREGHGVYLWLQLEGTVEPRAYRLPWDAKLAEQLERAREEAERNGTPLVMELPFERSFDARERKFYALPQPARPEKPLARPGPGGGVIYQRPGEEA